MIRKKKIIILVFIIIIAIVVIWRIFFPNLFAKRIAPNELSEGSTLLTEESNILIAYFSRIGNTLFDTDIDAVSSASITLYNNENLGNCEVAAKISQEVTKGDIFFIATSEKYPGNFNDTSDQTSQEKRNNVRPQLAAEIENFEKYDTVILIFPIWWGDLPQPVVTFLENYDFSEKTIIPISTSGGSGLGTTPQEIAALCPNSQILEGLSIRENAVGRTKKIITACLKKAGIIKNSK